MTQSLARTRYDFTSPVEDGLLTKEAFDFALSERGVEVSSNKVRMWRTRGLLPHAVRGGLSRYSEDSVAQAVEAHRLFEMRNNEAFVGWELWWRGFDVAEVYWRPVLEARTSATARLTGICARLASRLADNTRPSMTEVIWKLHEAALTGALVPRKGESDALARLSERDSRERERVLQSGLDPASAAATILANISATQRPNLSSLHFKENRVGNLLAARDDVRSVLEAASALHDAVVMVAPWRAAGLKPVKWLHDHAGKSTKADLAMRWMMAVDQHGPLIDRADIVQMRADAFATLSRAQDFSRLCARNGKLSQTAYRRRLSEAVRRDDALEALCGRIRRDLAE